MTARMAAVVPANHDPGTSPPANGSHEDFEDQGHQKQPERRTDHTAQQEKRRPCFAGLHAKARAQKAVDAGQSHLVVQGQENGGNNQVSNAVAKHHLHVRPFLVAHPAWNAQERHPRERGADHAKRHEGPRGAFLGHEEDVFLRPGPMRGPTRHGQQHANVGEGNAKREGGGHGAKCNFAPCNCPRG